MSDIAIKVENISKKYEIGAAQIRHDTLRDQILHGVRSLVGRNRKSTPRTEVFWALKDVSFQVRQGDVVGIIGRNGAGKSTILKILSRITYPTTGNAEIHGRVASLLEVGTGFHGELTGRENIFLNGAIMGMRLAEIKRKFDEIVEFSGVSQFIDTPVKRYSSGMYVRLAFAVAAHLESEILIVDEVLAVGDVTFQKKCLGKIGHIAKTGRTVLFVSHNMSAVQNLCNTGIILSDGAVDFWGSTGQAVDRYINSTSSQDFGCVDLRAHRGRPAGMAPLIQSVALRGTARDVFYRDTVTTGEDVVFEIRYDTRGLDLDYAVLGINSHLGERVCTVGTHLYADFDFRLHGKGVVECRLPRLALTQGEYNVVLAIGTNRRNVDMVDDALRFHVEPGDYFGTGATPIYGQGHLAQKSEWRLATEAPQVLAQDR